MSRKQVFSLEEGDKGNKLGLQIKAYMSSNNTKVFVRFFKYNGNCYTVFNDGKRTFEEVWDKVLNVLKNFRIIKDPNNWEYSIDDTSKFEASDILKNEFGKEKVVFFAFKVKEMFLRF